MMDVFVQILIGIIVAPFGVLLAFCLKRLDAVQDIFERFQNHTKKSTLKRLDKLSREAEKIRALKSSPIAFMCLVISRLTWVILSVSHLVFMILFTSLVRSPEKSPADQLLGLIIISILLLGFIAVVAGSINYYAVAVRNYNNFFPCRARKILKRAKIPEHDIEAMLKERQLYIEYESFDKCCNHILVTAEEIEHNKPAC